MRTDEDKFTRGRVTMREKFSDDLWRFRVDPGEGFKYVAGQYATLGVEKDGKRIERAYSLVSSPYEKELEFFFELVPHGATTPPLYDLQLGAEVLVCGDVLTAEGVIGGDEPHDLHPARNPGDAVLEQVRAENRDPGRAHRPTSRCGGDAGQAERERRDGRRHESQQRPAPSATQLG